MSVSGKKKLYKGSNEICQTLFSSQNSILKIKVVRLRTRFFDAPSRGKSARFSRELSSIFIPSKKDYNSPAATFSNLFHERPSVVARRRERRQLRRLVVRLHSLTTSLEGGWMVRGVEVESRRRISTCRNRFRSGDEKQTPRIDFGSLSNQLLIQYSFLRDITFNLHTPCPIPDRPFALFRNHLLSLALLLLRFVPPFFSPLTAFSTSEMSYRRPDRGSGKCRHVLHNIEIF